MTIIKPISTNIRQIIKIDNDFLIIREDYYQFEGVSNVYCLKDNNIIWYAELPSKEDYYSNDLQIRNGNLQSSSWGGFTIKIDIKTGKILEKAFSK